MQFLIRCFQIVKPDWTWLSFIPAADFLHRFSLFHFRFVDHITFYVKNTQALYVDIIKWESGGMGTCQSRCQSPVGSKIPCFDHRQ